jgi:hypothetical protein
MVFYDGSGVVRREFTVTGFENADSFLKKMNGALASRSESSSITQSSVSPQ